MRAGVLVNRSRRRWLREFGAGIAAALTLVVMGFGAYPASATGLALSNFHGAEGGSGESLYIWFDLPSGLASLAPADSPLIEVRTGRYMWAGIVVSLNGTPIPPPIVNTGAPFTSAGILITGLTPRATYDFSVSLPIGVNTYTGTGRARITPLSVGSPDIQLDGIKDRAVSRQLTFGGVGATYEWLWDKGGFNPDRDVFGDHLTYSSSGLLSGTTPAMGWEQFTVNASGGTVGAITKVIWVVIDSGIGMSNIVACSVSPTPPCIYSATVDGSPATVLSRKYIGSVDTFVRVEGSGTINSVVDVTFDMGDTPASTGYFGLSSGHPQSLDVSTVGGHQHVRAVTKPEWGSLVANTYPGPYCRIGDCAADLVGNDDILSAGIVLWPVGVNQSGTPYIPIGFSGGWIASNAQSLAMGLFSGKLSFDVAAPHYRRDGITVNRGFFETYIPDAALSSVFATPGVDAATFAQLMKVTDALAGGSTSVITDAVTVVSRTGGLFVSSSNLTYSSHNITIEPVVAVVVPTAPSPPSGGSSGGSSSSPASTGTSTATTALAPSNPVTAAISAQPAISGTIAPLIILKPSATTAQQMSAFTPTQLASVAPNVFAQLNPTAISAITPAQAKNMTPAQLSFITPAGAAKIRPATLASLNPAQLAGFRPAAAASIVPAAIRALSGAQLAGFRPGAVALMAPSTIASMSNAQLKALTDVQVKAMTKQQLKLLTPSQRKALDR